MASSSSASFIFSASMGIALIIEGAMLKSDMMKFSSQSPILEMYANRPLKTKVTWFRNDPWHMLPTMATIDKLTSHPPNN